MQKQIDEYTKQEKELEDLKNEVRTIREKQHEKLEKIAGLSKQDARDKLMKMTENDIKQDLVNLVAKGAELNVTVCSYKLIIFILLFSSVFGILYFEVKS